MAQKSIHWKIPFFIYIDRVALYIEDEILWCADIFLHEWKKTANKKKQHNELAEFPYFVVCQLLWTTWKMVSHQLVSINKCSRRLFFWRVMISIHLFPSQILLCGTCHVYFFCLLSYGQNEMNYVVNQRGFPLIVAQTDLSRVREKSGWGDGKNS